MKIHALALYLILFPYIHAFAVMPDFEAKNLGSHYFRELTPSDFQDVLSLEDVVVEDLKSKGLSKILRRIDPAELNIFLQGGGFKVIGSFFENKLVGIRVIKIPSLVPLSENLGKYILPTEQIDSLAHFEISMVNPLSRKKASPESKQESDLSIGQMMNELAVDYLKEMGIQHLCATIAPTNIPNLMNARKIGLKVAKYIPNKYGEGEHRFLMYRNLTSPLTLIPSLQKIQEFLGEARPSCRMPGELVSAENGDRINQLSEIDSYGNVCGLENGVIILFYPHS